MSAHEILIYIMAGFAVMGALDRLLGDRFGLGKSFEEGILAMGSLAMAMIGVITLISVQERTKEIGILRAIGASKRNVSSMFNAETVIIGFTSGALGVGITYLLCIPINAILFYLTGLGNLRAYLPWQVALILVGISVLLTMFAGVIPSRSAAKKDPVVALRTE